VDWWTGTRYEGERETTLAAPLDTIPCLVMAGAPVPLLRPTIDTLSPVEDAEAIDSLASSHGLLYARVATGTVGGFTLVRRHPPVSEHRLRQGPRLTYTPGDDWFEGAVFEVIGLGTQPTEVLDAQGKPPSQSAATLEALDALDTGTAWTDAQGGTLHHQAHRDSRRAPSSRCPSEPTRRPRDGGRPGSAARRHAPRLPCKPRRHRAGTEIGASRVAHIPRGSQERPSPRFFQPLRRPSLSRAGRSHRPYCNAVSSTR
jgi:hypothetical protein